MKKRKKKSKAKAVKKSKPRKSVKKKVKAKTKPRKPAKAKKAKKKKATKTEAHPKPGIIAPAGGIRLGYVEDYYAKIGVVAPLDAGLVQFGRGIRNSVRVAVDEANRRHAVPGWRFEVDALNDSSNAATGEAAAGRLAADATVIGMVGTYNSGVAARVAPVLSRAGIVMISPASERSPSASG